MKFHEESFNYVVGVDISKAKLDVALPMESLEIGNAAVSFLGCQLCR